MNVNWDAIRNANLRFRVAVFALTFALAPVFWSAFMYWVDRPEWYTDNLAWIVFGFAWIVILPIVHWVYWTALDYFAAKDAVNEVEI